MRISKTHPLLHVMLALLLLANGLLSAAQPVHAGHLPVTGMHSHAADDHHTVGNEHDVSRHADQRHEPHHYEQHHIAAIDGGTDEHGHHFHVHLPAHALVSTFSPFEYAAAVVAVPAQTPLLPASLTYAPPVPPPTA